MAPRGDTARRRTTHPADAPGRIPRTGRLPSVAGMENAHVTSTVVPPRRARPALVLALAATVVVWPALDALGLTGLPLVGLALLVTATVWVVVLGLLDAPRPVLTGALAGLAYGIALVGLSFGLGDGRPGGLVAVLAGVWELAWTTLLGTGLGLLGSAVRRMRGVAA